MTHDRLLPWYLRTDDSGGMPSQLADDAEEAQLRVGADAWPMPGPSWRTASRGR